MKRTNVLALTANTPSFRGSRTALFDDSPSASSALASAASAASAAAPEQDVPGATHHASDAHIARLVSRVGAVPLVRQLAGDLAAREAELVRVRARAEARERELRKMLREVEVGNHDIDATLKRLEDKEGARGGASGEALDGKVKAMMEEALGEGVGPREEWEAGEAVDPQATIRGSGPRDADRGSTHSSQDTTESKARGWRDYLWSGSGTRKTSRTSSTHSGRDDDSGKGKARARASSGAAATATKRRGLNENVFRPPPPPSAAAMTRTASSDTTQSADKARSTSMAAWTLKMFAGNPAARDRDAAGRPTSRGRAATQGSAAGAADDMRAASQMSHQSATSGAAGLSKVRTQSSSKPLRPLNISFGGALKGSGQQSVRSLPMGSPASEHRPPNLGPVEMDAILPQGSRPPTLTPSYQNLGDTEDYLTDRFGFIYDQKRRKKEADALASLAALKKKSAKETASLRSLGGESASLSDAPGSRPDSPASGHTRNDAKSGKRWQDFLQMATYPTELLVHTPSPSPGTIMTLANEDIRTSLKRNPTYGESGERTPATGNTLQPTLTPASATVTSGNAELARPVVSMPTTPSTPSKGDYEPVKALLAQLTEVHDKLQAEKEVKWNEFLRKVRAERRRDGETVTTTSTADARPKPKINAEMPEASLADGEMIGIATLGHRGKAGRAKYNDFKALVLSGIPVTLRAKIWVECSGAAELRVPSYYADLVHGIAADDNVIAATPIDATDAEISHEDDPAVIAQIDMDIPRTLTDNVFFRRGPGAARLREVLLAYARRNRAVGYCQGMNLIAASLLLALPTSEDAFWLLAAAVETILPARYYDPSLLASRADQRVLRDYVSELLPKLSRHLDALGVELEALTFPWFLSLFTACLSAEALYRVWDVLLCRQADDAAGGSTFLFRVALALLQLNEAPLSACQSPGELYAYLGGEITNHAISIDGLIRASEGLRGLVKRSEVEERRARWIEVEEETIRERAIIRGEMKARYKAAKQVAVEARTGHSAAEIEGELQVQEPIPVE